MPKIKVWVFHLYIAQLLKEVTKLLKYSLLIGQMVMIRYVMHHPSMG